MSSLFADDFGPFEGRAWFNCAHQGPLPKVAVSAAHLALRQKITPHLIDDQAFTDAPNALKGSLASLVHASADDIILGNSASYGLHVLRNGVSWNAGDEILLVQGDFPATIYPWLALKDSGVRVRILTPRGSSLTVDELRSEITHSSRLLCVSWVNSFNGSVLDLSAIGQFCREHRIIFVVNGSQGVGAMRVSVEREPIDALVSCGYKWLCGPYGTGFCWIHPKLRNQLRPNQTYWLPQVWQQHEFTDYTMKKETTASVFDVFCTANFMNFMPWTASVGYLLGIGMAIVEKHNRALVQKLSDELNRDTFRMISPESLASSILVITHREPERNVEIHAALAFAGIDAGLRNGNLRFSLHLYNTLEEVGRAIEVLNSAS